MQYNTSGPPRDKRRYKDISVDDKAAPVRVYEDGSIEATSFVDTTSSDLFYEKYQDKAYYFGEKLDDNTEIRYFPGGGVDKVYRTVVKKNIRIKHAFAVFKGSVRKLVIQDMERFKHLPKRAKKIVKNILNNKKVFHFIYPDLGQPWANPYIESTTFGPYNYDVRLKVTKDIEFINDLIVVKTGEFVTSNVKGVSGASIQRKIPGNETIVYITPHDMVDYDGSLGHYCYTGDHAQTGTMPSGAVYGSVFDTFRDITVGVTNTVNVNAVSSRFVNIPSGQFLGGDHYYTRHDHEVIKTEEYNGDLENTILSNFYPKKFRDKMLSGTWDGIIPSGAYFRIESWSTNPKYAGFDGEISIVDVGEKHKEIDFGGEFSGVAMSKSYDDSVRNAVKGADLAFNKKLNNYLTYKGCRNPNNKKKRFDVLLEKVAQNIYDGLSLMNNEKLGSNQGTVSNPLDSPMYYEGNSKAHGGSVANTNYDYSTAPADKYDDIVFYGPLGQQDSLGGANTLNTSQSDPFENYTFSESELGGAYSGQYM